MKTNSHDRTAIGAILLGTAGALVLATLVLARAQSPQLADALALTPYEVAPRMINESAVGRAVAFAYPSRLREAGIGGSVQVRFFIDEKGIVQKTRLLESSGHPQLDVAALAMAGLIEFTPAMNKGETVPVWISLPITFEAR